jgi:hypothetical protein
MSAALVKEHTKLQLHECESRRTLDSNNQELGTRTYHFGQHPTRGVTVLIFRTEFLALDPARRLAVST